MIEKLFKLKYLLYTLWIPFWHFQRIMPRNKKIWIFGAWYGKKYSDNSRALFEFILEHDPSVNIIWLTNDVDIRNRIRLDGNKSELITSPKGIIYSLRAGVVIFSSGINDVNKFFINGAKIINLWHGSPLKKIGLDDIYSLSETKERIIRIFYPFLSEYRIDLIINAADIFIGKFSSAFGINENKVLSCGYPRNDFLFSNKIDPITESLNRKFDNPLKIIYLPTFRSLSQKFQPFNSFKYNEKDWSDFLEKHNMIFMSKGHFIDNQIGSNLSSDRIIHLSDRHVDELTILLKDIDILITDYSSVFFDFLLLNKPVIFAPFDMDTYVTESRQLYFKYEDVACGPISYDWHQVMLSIEEIITNDVYKNRRIEANKVFNKNHDSKSSERLYEYIKSMI